MHMVEMPFYSGPFCVEFGRARAVQDLTADSRLRFNELVTAYCTDYLAPPTTHLLCTSTDENIVLISVLRR